MLRLWTGRPLEILILLLSYYSNVVRSWKTPETPSVFHLENSQVRCQSEICLEQKYAICKAYLTKSLKKMRANCAMYPPAGYVLKNAFVYCTSNGQSVQSGSCYLDYWLTPVNSGISSTWMFGLVAVLLMSIVSCIIFTRLIIIEPSVTERTRGVERNGLLYQPPLPRSSCPDRLYSSSNIYRSRSCSTCDFPGTNIRVVRKKALNDLKRPLRYPEQYGGKRARFT